MLVKSRVHEDIKNKLTDEIMSANIRIARVEDHGNRISYYDGASGVIFKKEGNTYYALTAFHVIQKLYNDNSVYRILSYNSPNVSMPLKKYYEQYPEAEIVFYSEEDDLAVIKFSSDEDLKVLNIAIKNPKKGEPICTIGNPGRERFVVTYGYVKSNRFYSTNLSDTNIPKTGIKISAYTEDGNSGGAVLNEKNGNCWYSCRRT